MSGVVVEFEGVTKAFGHSRGLREVSFCLRRGEIMGFIGPNGCGKTTAVRLTLGFYEATQGAVSVFGTAPATALRDRGWRVGVMLHQPGLCEALTPQEYLEYCGGLVGLEGAARQGRIRDVLDLVGLSDRARASIRTFSRGMRQRLSMARCFLNDPTLVVLDEPFDALDFESRRALIDLLARHQRESGTSAFVTSHNLGEVERVCDRVALVTRGQIIAMGTLEMLRQRLAGRGLLVIRLAKDYAETELPAIARGAKYSRQARSLTFDLGSIDGGCDALLMGLLRARVSIDSVERRSATLEDIYLSLTEDRWR